jgi:hypothetical protein
MHVALLYVLDYIILIKGSRNGLLNQSSFFEKGRLLSLKVIHCFIILPEKLACLPFPDR